MVKVIWYGIIVHIGMYRGVIFIGCVHVHSQPFTTFARIPSIATDVATRITKVPGKCMYLYSTRGNPSLS